MKNTKIHEYLYKAENLLDEFVIAVLSFGAIFVTVYTFTAAGDSPDWIAFGNIIEPWITMLALMIIGRELWLMNVHKRKEVYGEGE